VTITWNSEKPEYISNEGIVTQPTEEEGIVSFKVTATFTFNGISDEKTYYASVIYNPNQ
jgi:hypothetical protein